MMTTKTVSIPNMNCGHCTSTIERELTELEGIQSVKTEIGKKQVTIEWAESLLTWAQIVDLLEEMGYPPVN